MYAHQLSLVESDVLSLVESVPEPVFDFVPMSGTFTGARTFGEQVRHLGTVLQLASVVLNGDSPPFKPGKGNNGPETVRGRDATIRFLRESFTAARASIQTLTEANHMETIPSLFGRVPRSSIAVSFLAHSYNHYGQMVVYARMRGIVPPGSIPTGDEDAVVR
jgi:hypothetical protein